MASAESYEQRLTDSTTVLREMSHASDKGIPQDLLQKARCVVVVPGLKKVAFIGGGKYGRGYASCMTRKGWSPPAAVRIEGGSFGLQLGGSSTDVIMLVLNEGGMKKLLSDKFTLGRRSRSRGRACRTQHQCEHRRSDEGRNPVVVQITRCLRGFVPGRSYSPSGPGREREALRKAADQRGNPHRHGETACNCRHVPGAAPTILRQRSSARGCCC